MAGKRFPGSMFGFNKASVNNYLENLIKDYEEKLNAKDMELEKVNKHLRSVTSKYEELRLDEEQVRSEKEKISGALVKANEMADKILEEAKGKAAGEVSELEAAAEREREKIVDIRKNLMRMKSDAAAVLSTYSKAIDAIILEEEEPEIEYTEESVEETETDAAAADDTERETDDFFG